MIPESGPVSWERHSILWTFHKTCAWAAAAPETVTADQDVPSRTLRDDLQGRARQDLVLVLQSVDKVHMNES